MNMRNPYVFGLSICICISVCVYVYSGLGSSVCIATDCGPDGSRWDEIFRTCLDRPWGPPSLLYNGYRLYPGGKVRPGRAADHSPPFNATVMEE